MENKCDGCKRAVDVEEGFHIYTCNCGVLKNIENMNTNKQRAQAQIQEQAEQKAERAKYVKLVRAVRSDITNSGLNSVKYKLEHVEKMSVKTFRGIDKDYAVSVYKEAIDKHLKKCASNNKRLRP